MDGTKRKVVSLMHLDALMKLSVKEFCNANGDVFFLDMIMDTPLRYTIAQIEKGDLFYITQ